jgi:HEAT repeat protein
VAYDVFAVDPVCGLAEEPNPRVRSNAMWVLSQIQDPDYPAQMRAVDRTLRRGLEDVEPTVRFEAASGLAARGAWDVLPILIEGLEHPDSGVRYRCHEQLLQTTSRNLGYAVDAPAADRREFAARWRAWYEDWARTHG